MAGDKYLKLNTTSGNPAEQAAVQSSAGVGNAGNIPALDSTGRLSDTMMPLGVVPEVVTAPAFEDLSAGNFVNFFSDSGTFSIRKADNSNGRQADGFVKSAFLTGATVTAYTDGTNANLSGLTIGTRYFLGTAGGTSATVPSAGAGVLVQPLGIAKSATELIFESASQIVERAA